MTAAIAILGAAMIQAVGGSPTQAVGSVSETFQATFGKCIVQYKRRQARQFVIGHGSSPIDGRCLHGEWAQASLLEPTYRYMLARALIQQDYATGVPEGIATLGEVGNAPLAPREKKDIEASRRLVLADCVVRRAPTEAFALAQAEAGEASAAAPMNKLAPVVADCSTAVAVRYPSGFQVQEAIVTRLYQLAYAARKPTDA